MPSTRAPSRSPVETEIFRHLFISVTDDMGVTLERTAYSPNIKERRDYSCALFDSQGLLVAQAAHIPVHLGAFPLMMERVAPRFRWRPGDVVICNDPLAGGTHLPDISLIAPVFGGSGRLSGFVANRAHHADVGGAFPGSLAATTEIYQEGLIIPPLKLYDRGVPNTGLLEVIFRNVRTPVERRGDLSAQLSANAIGVRRFQELLRRHGISVLRRRIGEARADTERAIATFLRAFPPGAYEY